MVLAVTVKKFPVIRPQKESNKTSNVMHLVWYYLKSRTNLLQQENKLRFKIR